MPFEFGFVVIAALTSGSASFQTVDPGARRLVERGAEALGGLDRLRGIAGLRVEEIGREYMVATLTGPTAPRRIIHHGMVQVRDHRRDAIRWSVDSRWPMRAEPTRQISTASAAAGMVVQGTAIRADTRTGWSAARAELELAPERVLLTALGAPDLRLKGPQRVRFGYRDGEVEIEFDARTDFPARIIRRYADPNDFYSILLGDVVLETTWSGWALDPIGIWYPRQRSVQMNGEPFREYSVAGSIGTDPAPDSTAIPDSIASRFVSAASPAAAIVLAPRTLRENIVLYYGGYQAFAVRQRDGIVVVEAPQSSLKSRAILEDLAARWPGVPVKAVIATSPMWTHIGGIREYVARRIPVFATDGVAAGARGFVASPHRLAPDSLARAPEPLRLTVVDQARQLGSGADRLELVPGRGPHGGSMLVVALPAAKLVYASDILVPDSFEPFFKAGYRAETIRTVAGLDFVPDTVFALHVGPMPWADVVGGVEIKAAR